ncbi:MAG: dockerin type I domain-containing protein [Ilumatobacteraceae bacterium]
MFVFWAFAHFSGAAHAEPLPGDLDGDGTLGIGDETWLKSLYGAAQGDALYDAAADGNGDGRIDHLDLALFGGEFGATGGDPDTDPPGLLVTLNHIPDDQNDLLVVPPELFQVTLLLDSDGGSVVDPTSLSVTWSEDIEGIAAGNELAGLFTASPELGFYEAPAGSDLRRTSHYLTVSVRDAAGNEAQDVYGFAVRDFGLGAPFAETQQIWVDFGRDRNLGAEVDFIEDLREFGLSSPVDAALELLVRDRLVADILARAHEVYGRNADGSPGPDAVDLVFTDTVPTGTYANLCVGGESPTGPQFLGLAVLDNENLVKNENTCSNNQYGVFPHAIDDLWEADPSYLSAFGAVDPDVGGTPLGENPVDPIVLAPGFDPGQATPEQLTRWFGAEAALGAFSSLVGTIVAHETGHLVGLVAHDAPPAGLYGGTTGGRTDHNVTPTGATPSENLVMNAGGSFTFDEITGGNGVPLATFKPLSWAYLTNRIALNANVTGLFPAPELTAVAPNPAAYPQGGYTVPITITGDGFLETPIVEVLREGSPTWDDVIEVTWQDAQTLTGTLNIFVVIPDPLPYDVRVTNPDGQVVILEDHLWVTQE